MGKEKERPSIDDIERLLNAGKKVDIAVDGKLSVSEEKELNALEHLMVENSHLRKENDRLKNKLRSISELVKNE